MLAFENTGSDFLLTVHLLLQFLFIPCSTNFMATSSHVTLLDTGYLARLDLQEENFYLIRRKSFTEHRLGKDEPVKLSRISRRLVNLIVKSNKQ